MSFEVYLWADLMTSKSDSKCQIYHTSICLVGLVGRFVFSYSSKGLSFCTVTDEHYVQRGRKPDKVYYLGETYERIKNAMDYAYDLERTEFRTYNVRTTNCNHFCNALSLWLCGERIPTKYFLQSEIILKLNKLSCLATLPLLATERKMYSHYKV